MTIKLPCSLRRAAYHPCTMWPSRQSAYQYLYSAVVRMGQADELGHVTR